jgi:hypothetical protein
MIGIIMLDRTAGLDGFERIHGCFLGLGTFGVEFDVEVNVVVDHMFAEKGKKATRAVMTAELGAVDFELGLAGEVVGIGGSYDGWDAERLCHTPQSEGTLQRVIRQARAG